MTQDVTNVIAQVPATVEALTGVDLMTFLRDLPPVKSAGEGEASEEAGDGGEPAG